MLAQHIATIDHEPFLAASSLLKVPRHRAVFRTGDAADRFFEVDSGAVMVCRRLDDGRRQVVEVVFAGGMCGLAEGEVHASCCETLMPTVLRSHKRSALFECDLLRLRVVESLRRQLSAMHDHTLSLGRKTAEERICTLILRLREQASDEVDLSAVPLPMTRTEMADYLGLTLETVCRTIGGLIRRNVLEQGQHRGELRVPSVELLRQAACAA